MDPRKFAQVFGIATLIVGALSLVPSLSSMDALPALDLNFQYGNFLGYFPMNVMNKVAMIAMGVAGLLAANAKFNALPRSISYARLVCLLTGVMATLGSIPATSTLFGYWPLFGSANVAAATVFSLASAAAGWYLTSKSAAHSATSRVNEPLTSR